VKHLMQWATRLYPRAWRKRYGEEFRALLEDSSPQARDTWDIARDAWDIAKEALSMQIQRTAVLAVIGTMLGGLAGGLISLYRTRHRDGYVAGAVMTLRVADAGNAAASGRAIRSLIEASWTRDALADIMTTSRLYEPERSRTSPDALVRRMRENIKISSLSNSGHLFQIEFTGAGPDQAEKVRRALVAHLIDDNVRLRPSPPATIELLESLPVSHAVPRRSTLIAAWTVVGACLGLALAWLRVRARPQVT
jgi:hypothetical protein